MNEIETDYKIPKGMIVEEFTSRKSLTVRKGNYKLVLTMEMGLNYNKDEILKGEGNITHATKGHIEKISNSYSWKDYNVQLAINALRKYPSIAEENNTKNISIKEFVDDRMGIRSPQGNTGIIGQYYNKPCVLSYCFNKYIGVIYFKTTRKYKACSIFNSPIYYHPSTINEITLKEAAKLFDEIVNPKPVLKKLSESDEAAIISLLV